MKQINEELSSFVGDFALAQCNAGCDTQEGLIQMPSKQNLFGEAGRSLELLVGWVCALISLIFGGLLAVCIYLVAWRNPREFGVHELFEVKTLVIFSFFLVIAVSFSLFASRLLSTRGPGQRLMSANVLRAWGAFFAGATIFIIMNAIVNRKCGELPQLWYALSASISVGVAAFSRAELGEERSN